MIDKSNNCWLNVGDVAESSSGCFVLRTGNVFGVDSGGQERAAKSELSRGVLRSSKGAG